MVPVDGRRGTHIRGLPGCGQAGTLPDDTLGRGSAAQGSPGPRAQGQTGKLRQGAGVTSPGVPWGNGHKGCSTAEATCLKPPQVADGEQRPEVTWQAEGEPWGPLHKCPPQTHHLHHSFPFLLPGQAGAAFQPHPSQGPWGACRCQEARGCETGPVWTLPPEPQRPCQPVRGPPPQKNSHTPEAPHSLSGLSPPPLLLSLPAHRPPSRCGPRSFALLSLCLECPPPHILERLALFHPSRLKCHLPKEALPDQLSRQQSPGPNTLCLDPALFSSACSTHGNCFLPASPARLKALVG